MQFDLLDNTITNELQQLLEQPPSSPIMAKPSTYYAACNNLDAINQVDDVLFKQLIYQPLLGLPTLEQQLAFLIQFEIPAFFNAGRFAHHHCDLNFMLRSTSDALMSRPINHPIVLGAIC
jgi:hypothetical protein